MRQRSPSKPHHSPLFWAILAALAAACLLTSHPIHAQSWTFSTQRLSLRAAPYWDFPEVAWVAPGQQVGLYGCLYDMSWCEVSWNNYRGWVGADSVGVQATGWAYSPAGRYWFLVPQLAPPPYRVSVGPVPPLPVLRPQWQSTQPYLREEVIDRTPRLPQVEPVLPF